MERTTRWGTKTRVHDANRGREILLNAAVSCISRDGLKLTTMQKIAEEAQISRRTVHRYFQSKRKLISEVTMYIEDKTFLSIESKANPYQHDFFDYLEEAVVLGVSGLTVVANFKSKLGLDEETGDEASFDAARRKFHDEQLSRWVRLLRKPYRNHTEAIHNKKVNVAPLEIYAELAILLVTGHYQLQSSEAEIRASFRDISALAQRHTEFGKRESPASSNPQVNSNSRHIKSLFTQ